MKPAVASVIISVLENAIKAAREHVSNDELRSAEDKLKAAQQHQARASSPKRVPVVHPASC